MILRRGRPGRLLGLFDRPGRLLTAAAVVGAGLLFPGLGEPQDRPDAIPRTPDGRPDLQGNWSNATLTRLQRPEGFDRVMTPRQVLELESDREELRRARSEDSDPARPPPPVGGDGSANDVGGYNYFYMDAGDRVAVYDGEPRSSLIVYPEDGRVPALTAEGQRERRQWSLARERFGELDHPELRPLSERCILSFGSETGPPMLPNYAYNNNYTIVQTPDHVMIMAEMVHDVRVIPIRESAPPPSDLTPWFGISWGRWEGDTLVIETTNIPREQLFSALYAFPGGSADLKVIERLTRVDENTINYEFTVDDPAYYSDTWRGEIPLHRLSARLYEYACHEANYALFNVLSGARAQEREGETGSRK